MSENKEALVVSVINKICDAVGFVVQDMIWDPTGLKRARINTADAYLKNILDSEMSYEEKRVLIQEFKLMFKKSDNRKEIINNAFPHIEETSNPENVENGWIFDFWDKSGSISTEDLQKLWGKVLAQEINKPNTVSKKLLHNLSIMSYQDALNFMNLCRFCFEDTFKDLAYPFIYIKERKNTYENSKITTNILKELEQFSLIEINYDTGFCFYNKIKISHGRYDAVILADKIPAGNVILTTDGQVLYKIVKELSESNRNKHQIFEYVIEHLQNQKCNIEFK